MRTLVLLLALLLAPAAAAAQDGRAAGPVIPKGKGEQCVAETEYMRRFHMTELDHQRDDTMQRGVRTKRFSLKECVACHATTDSAGRPVSINAPGQFCATCHAYAAVTIDCFQCHATKPESGDQARLPSPLPMTAAAGPETVR
jgi:hypothetical protein